MLKRRLREVNSLLKSGKLPGVRLENGKIIITPFESEVPEKASSFSDRIYSYVPQIRLTDLLVEVEGWTGFSRCFTHLYTGKASSSKALLLTNILKDALNMNKSRMAQATPEITLRPLEENEEWFLREENYVKGLAEVLNMQHNQPFAANWGDGTTSSSDAQNFPLKYPKAKGGEINPKYLPFPSVNYYSHTTDRYGPLYIQPISSVIKDAPYVLDGLLYHETDIEIEEHYTDTGGYSDQVFGLCHLLGFRFSPRIRDLSKLKLYYFEDNPNYPALESILGSEINESKLGTHWKEVLRLAASVKEGTVTASLMMKKLNRANGMNLVAACIILWNTVYLYHVVETLRSNGEDVPQHLLPHVSPVKWEHINLGGEFFWDFEQVTLLNALRPLIEKNLVAKSAS